MTTRHVPGKGIPKLFRRLGLFFFRCGRHCVTAAARMEKRHG